MVVVVGGREGGGWRRRTWFSQYVTIIQVDLLVLGVVVSITAVIRATRDQLRFALVYFPRGTCEEEASHRADSKSVRR